MDCRRTLWLGLGLLTAAAGCQHDIRINPVAPTPQAQALAPAPAVVQAVPPNAVVRKEADLPRKTPHASTCVAAGDCLAQQALAPDLGETAKVDCQDRARKAYQQALSIDPHYLPAYQSLAALYVAMKDHAHAVATYQKAAQTFPNAAARLLRAGHVPRRREGMGPGHPQPDACGGTRPGESGKSSTRWAGCKPAPAVTTTASPHS